MDCHYRDLDSQDALPAFSGELLYSIPPATAQLDRDTRLSRLLPHCDEVKRIVYISTSGVYGDCGGEWVDETREPAPRTDRARRRLAAETQLGEWQRERAGRELLILRIPGIYGPGRLPRKRLEEGRPILNLAESPWSNRIHADDLARICEQALRQANLAGIYNVSDGQPSQMSEYFLQCAAVLGLPAPEQISWAQAQKTFSPQLLSFYEESRRLIIDKLRRDFAFEPRYASVQAGLRQSLDTQDH